MAQASLQVTFQSLCDLLRPLAGAGDDPRATIARVNQHDVWLSIVKLAGDELVTPQLAVAMAEQGELLPDDVAAYCRTVGELSATRAKSLRDQLSELTPALNAGGIVPLLLKGAAYEAVDLYPADGARAFSDLDLLIRKGDLTRATAVLQGLGYRAIDPQSDLGDDHHHLPAMMREGRLAAIELHQHPLRWQCRGALTTDEIFSAASANTSFGGQVLVPSATHLALHNILHAEVSNYRYWSASFLLRDALDLAAIARRFSGQVDWAAITARLKAVGFESVAGFYAKTTFEIFSLPAPDAIERITKGRLAHAIWRRRLRGLSHALQPALRVGQVVTVGRRAIADKSLVRHLRSWGKLALNRLVAARVSR